MGPKTKKMGRRRIFPKKLRRRLRVWKKDLFFGIKFGRLRGGFFDAVLGVSSKKFVDP